MDDKVIMDYAKYLVRVHGGNIPFAQKVAGKAAICAKEENDVEDFMLYTGVFQALEVLSNEAA